MFAPLIFWDQRFLTPSPSMLTPQLSLFSSVTTVGCRLVTTKLLQWPQGPKASLPLPFLSRVLQVSHFLFVVHFFCFLALGVHLSQLLAYCVLIYSIGLVFFYFLFCLVLWFYFFIFNLPYTAISMFFFSLEICLCLILYTCLLWV